MNIDYNKWHSALALAEEDKDDSPWHKMVKLHLPEITNKRVLEIGCGRGAFSKFLCSRGANLVAADFSEAAIQITKKLLASENKCEFKQADIQNLPFESNFFDVVFSLETIEHVPDPNKALTELVRVTKPKGQIIVTTPNYFSFLGLYRLYRNYLTGRPYNEAGQPVAFPVTLYSRVKLLKIMGCKVITIEGKGHTIPWPCCQGIKVRWLDSVGFAKWIATHSLTIAIK